MEESGKSIFDSKSEKKYYKRLSTRWNKYVEVYPQIPVRNVIGFKEIKNTFSSEKAIDYLQKTSFDYVVCEKNSFVPILVIEFDGIGAGFSKEGSYIPNNNPKDAPYRKLKLDTKLEACNLNNIPMVIVSFEECEYLDESQDLLSVIDALIGEAIERRHRSKNHSEYTKQLSEAYERGGEKAVEATLIEIDMELDLVNPIKKKTFEITKQFPFWNEQIVFPQKEGDYLKGSFHLIGSFKMNSERRLEKRLVSVEISMRNASFYRSNIMSVFNSVGKYCLARKTQKELGTDYDKWKERNERVSWTKC